MLPFGNRVSRIAGHLNQVMALRADAAQVVHLKGPKPGVIERHVGLQAHVDAAPQTEQQVLVAFAQRVFDESLRVSLDRDAKLNIAFVTFYLGPAIINGRQVTKTYRVVFQLKDGQWVRL